MNEKIYDTDSKKIAFVIALLDEDSLNWKEQFLNNRTDEQGIIHLGDYEDFLYEIREDFKDVDAKADALYKIGNIHQGSKSVEAHNAEFKLLIRQSGLNVCNNNDVLVDYYHRSICPDILEKCWNLTPVPEALHQWMRAAQDVDS